MKRTVNIATIREEELKNRVATLFFGKYDCDRDFFLAEMNVDDKNTPEVSDDRPAEDFYITFDANPNASYYDIRAHFQGCKPNGAMNAKSDDATYNALLSALRTAHKALAAKIEPKVYEHGFLKR